MERSEGRPRTVALAGNPNVGKSTLFNALTGMRQHTGNWTGKTVGLAEGVCRTARIPLRIVDLPGTYSLCPHSEEERVARDYVCSGEADLVAVIADGVCLERSLILLLQLLSVSDRVVLCVNLLDEAEKKGIRVELGKLSSRLGIPVVGLSAREGRGIEEAIRLFEEAGASEGALRPREGEDLTALARAIASETVSGNENAHRRDRRIDRWLTGKYTAFPLMFCMLLGILWLTVSGANLPSEWLFDGFSWLEGVLLGGMEALGAPWWLSGALVLGIWRTVAWVVSVMLPPMAIFFPLFTILEDLGVLPRVAYNLDRCFRGCRASGKQALTM